MRRGRRPSLCVDTVSCSVVGVSVGLRVMLHRAGHVLLFCQNVHPESSVGPESSVDATSFISWDFFAGNK